MIDPATGQDMTDDNIYARYYTDAVQRIDLPTGLSSFGLAYNGNEIQKLSVSLIQPYTAGHVNVNGTFNLALESLTSDVTADWTTQI